MPSRGDPTAPDAGIRPSDTSALSIRSSVGAGDHPALAAIWRRAVDATHDFLTQADRDEIEAKQQTGCFPAVELSVAEREGRPVGFSGVLDGTLEMLFVEPTQRGSGIGTALLAHAVDAPS
ncbi:GNAT family N-acetyltransferase [Brachybacterium sp. EE-P12]|uniref:GNAT family N-acetyltransferase n=1 Tax=Candidatus Brachybacterium intestinipullorum TaxID=2838512 RepID=A0A9D2TJ70_9MICO|nr:GNAT family N-acetyltransferase [Brachybacterium sp. EE-P12]HJC71066.1 GNAT family N-acetyltransferase [Candidatus Brachybacterium intestinipullorum]